MTLIERIEAGETGREIDALAHLHFHPDAKVMTNGGNHKGEGVEYTPATELVEMGYYTSRHDWDALCLMIRAKPVSTSLDAVMALKDEVLPDWSFEVRRSTYGGTAQATVWNPNKSPIDRHEWRAQISYKEGETANPAAALLCAILKAKEANNG